MALEIRGLSQRQRVLADILWACDSIPEVELFIAGLPTSELKQEASTLVNLMIVQSQDRAVDASDDMTQANEIINRIKNL